MSRFARTVVPALAVAATATLARGSSIPLYGYNVVVTGTMTASSHVDGKSVVNNLGTSQLSEFGQKVAAGQDALVAKGTLSGSFKVYQGTFHHTGSLGTASIDYLNGAVQKQDTVASDVLSTMSGYMSSYSTGYAAMATTANAAAVQSGNKLSFNYTGTSTGQVVFKVDGSLFSSLSEISFSLGTATSAVIDVLGAGQYSASVNFTGVSNSASDTSHNNAKNILWNFSSASKFTTSNMWEGTILGPGLSLTTGQNIDGGVYVNNFTQGGEVHELYYTGPAPAPVPLPASVLTGGALLALLGGVRLVRSRRSR